MLAAEVPVESDEQSAYLRWMRQTGQRVAEMQLALASRSDVPEFAPEPITSDDVKTWSEQFLRRSTRVLDELGRRHAGLRPADRNLVEMLFTVCSSLPDRMNEMLPERIDAMKIRHHGDFHLGQMLIVRDDVFIIDFEGEPRRSLEERRRQAPAARDLAGLIRSIDYSTTAALDRALKTTSDEHGRIARALDEWRENSAAAVLDRLPRSTDRLEAMAARSTAGRPAARFLPVGKGILRDRIRAGASAGLAARAARRNLANPFAGGGRARMNGLSPEAYAVIEGRHSDPFHYLGRHVENNVSVVRVFLPEAKEVKVVDDKGHESELRRIHDAGLFAGRMANGSQRYHVRARFGEQVVDLEDPYRFPPVLSDFDLFLLGEGTHLRLYDKLGAHPHGA